MADIIFPDTTPDGVVGQTTLPTNVDLAFWKGDALEFVVRLTDENAVPIPLAGTTPAAVMKASFNSPTPYEFTTSIQNINEIRVYLPSSVSKTVPAGNYIWNLQITQANGDVRTYLAGDVTVYDEVDS